jgi:hypothetical protein
LPALRLIRVFLAIVLVEILTRVEMRAADLAVEFVRMCHEKLLFGVQWEHSA